jgi:tetratricopeptide (TPR) repeat protein
MFTNKAFFFFILCFALIFTAGSAYAAVEQLSSKWTASVDDEIKAIGTGDLDGDNVSEIIAACPRKVYVFNAAGRQIRTYSINFTASVIYVADINRDGLGEILIGAGYMETKNLSVERFDFTDKNNIREKPEILYKVSRSLGDVYMIKSGAKEPVKWLEVGDWVRDIAAEDLNGDGVPELLVASGGSNVDYIEKITTGTNPDTGNQTYIRNYTENRYENGSILVFLSNRSLAVSYRTNNVLWYVFPVYLQKASGMAIVSGSTDLSIWAPSGTVVSTFKSLDTSYTILDVFSDKISGGKAKEFLVWFSSPSVEGAYLLDLDGIMLWQYRSPSRNLRGVYSLNLDIDGGKEVILATTQNIYVLNGAGKLKWSYVLPTPIDKISVTDLGENKYTDFVMSSGKKILVYETNEKFIKAQLAATYYQEARDNYEAGKYSDALINLTSAKDIYSQLSDSEGLNAVDQLFLSINSSVKDVRKDTALSLYKKARNEYYLGKYAQAKELLIKAKDIYYGAGDSEGVTRCEDFLTELGRSEGTLAPTTSVPQEVSTIPEDVTVTTEPSSASNTGRSPLILGLAGIILVLLIGFGIKQMKDHKMARPKKPSKNKTQKDALDEVSIAVSREEPKGENKPEGSQETAKQNFNNAIPLGSEVSEKTDESPGSAIEKTVSSEPEAGKPSSENNSGETKPAAEGKAIPLGYAPEKKDEKEPHESVKTQETNKGSAE